MVGYVFKETEAWFDSVNDVADVGPKMAGIGFGLLASGDGKWLARITRSDDIHASTPWLWVKGFNVRPDRRRIHRFIRHARCKLGGSIGFPLDITNGSAFRQREFKPKLKPACAGTQGQHCWGMTIHI